MNRLDYLSRISDHLGVIAHQVEVRNGIRLYDINIICEDFYKGFLNLVYSLNLENLNLSDQNAKAIDLGDKAKRICIQVTSENSIEKVQDTVRKFEEDKRQSDYNVLIILMLKRIKKYRKLPKPVGYSLEVKDYMGLIRDVEKIEETDKLNQIAKFLDKELIDESRKKQEADSKLIEKFSDNASLYISKVAEHIVSAHQVPFLDQNLDTHELREKFRKMKCSPTYKRGFERNAVYFPEVNEIISSDAVKGGANTIRAIVDIIRNIYMKILDQFANGDIIHAHILGSLLKQKFAPEESMAAEVLIYFTVNECGIFNEEK